MSYSEEQLKEIAQEIFATRPNVTKLLATHDGNFFLEKDRSDASNYARESQQSLVIIERISHQHAEVAPAEQDDPQARDRAAVMLALHCTEEAADALIQRYKGNVEMLMKDWKRFNAQQSAAPEPETKAPGATKPASAAKRSKATKTTST
jgi:hypothetical protein